MDEPVGSLRRRFIPVLTAVGSLIPASPISFRCAAVAVKFEFSVRIGTALLILAFIRKICHPNFGYASAIYSHTA